MEAIIDYLGRRLREIGPTRWGELARQCGVAESLPRKIAYGDRLNPRVRTVQPLVDYFRAVDGAAQAGTKAWEATAASLDDSPHSNGRPLLDLTRTKDGEAADA